MGNVQCGSPDVDDTSFDSSYVSKAPPSPIRQCFAGTRGEEEAAATNDPFLQVHREDPEQKCIIDPKEVTKALMQQAEDLIRREQLEDQDHQDEASSLVDEGEDSLSDNDASTLGDASSYASGVSETAMTEVTTGTAATRPSRNVKYSSRSSKAKASKAQDLPPQMKGTQFKLMENLNHDVKSVLATAAYGKSVGKALSTATERLRTMERKDSSWNILSVPCIDNVATNTFAANALKAKGYMSVLHLKMKPQYPDYYQNHLSFLELESPTIRAGSREIPVSHLTPPRKSRQGAPAAAQEDPYVRGFNADMEFGEGPPSSPVRLSVTDSAFMDLAVTGSLGLIERPRSRLSMSSPPRKQLKSPAHYIVLLNRRSGIPLAVCALKAASTGPPVVRIYATKPRVFGQRPAASTRKLGLDWSESLPLYSWAEIVTEGRYTDKLRYSIFMATGSDGRFEEAESYRAVHDTSGPPVVRVLGRTERGDAHKGCAVISLARDEASIEEDNMFFNLSISRGIDPALLICFAALVDEVMEKNMRLRSY